MYVEFQTSTDKVLALVRIRIKRQKFCFTDTFPIPLLDPNAFYLLDHLEILPTTSIVLTPKHPVSIYGTTIIQASNVQLVQPVALFLAKLDDLAAAGPNGLPFKDPNNNVLDYLKVTGDVAFDVGIDQTKDGLQLSIKYNQIRNVQFQGLNVPLPDDLKKKVDSLLNQLDSTSPLDFSSLSSILGTIKVVQAGIGALPDGSLLVVRIEVQGTGQLDGSNAWSDFFNGNISKNLSISWDDPAPVEFDQNGHPIKNTKAQGVHHEVGGDFSLFINPEIIRPVLISQFQDSLTHSDQFKLKSGIDVQWFPLAPAYANFVTRFNGDVLNVGEFSQSVNTDVALGHLLQVEVINQLTLNTSLSWNPNQGDVAKVAISNTVLLGIFGAVAFAVFLGPIGFIVGLIVGLLVGIIVSIVAASNAGPGQFHLPGCSQPDDAEIVCIQQVQLPQSDLFGKLTVGSIYALIPGPILFGDIGAVVEFADPAIGVIEVLPFSWLYEDVCNSPSLHVSALIVLSSIGAGSFPLRLCRVSIPNGGDSLNQFGPYITTTSDPSGGYIMVTIDIPGDKVKKQYLDNAYPLPLLIQTNGGARFITLPAIQALTQQQQEQLFLDLNLQIGHCFEAADPFWSAIGRFNPKWSVDPGPEQKAPAAVHLWQVIVAGLALRESLVVQDAAGTVLRSVPASPGKPVSVDVVVAPSVQVSIVRGGAPTAPSGPSVAAAERRGRLQILQTLLVQSCFVPVPSPVADLASDYDRGRPLLFCTTESGVQNVYDLSIPQYPSMIRQVAVTPEGVARGDGAGGGAFANDPWFEGTTRIGKAIARPVAGGLEIWTLSSSYKMG